MDETNENNHNSTETKKPSAIKRTAKFLFDVPSWIGISTLSNTSSWLATIIKEAFRISKPGKKESFTEAKERLGVTPEDLAQQKKLFLRSSWILLGLAILALIYLAYMWHRSSWLVIIACIVVFCLLSIQAYFYSFWCLQIERQQLGCTFKDWLNWIFRGQK